MFVTFKPNQKHKTFSYFVVPTHLLSDLVDSLTKNNTKIKIGIICTRKSKGTYFRKLFPYFDLASSDIYVTVTVFPPPPRPPFISTLSLSDEGR